MDVDMKITINYLIYLRNIDQSPIIHGWITVYYSFWLIDMEICDMGDT